MIGGFYRPDAGSSAWATATSPALRPGASARAGIARTYQTTQLFGSLSVLDNVLMGLRRGRLGNPLASCRHRRPTAGLPRACSPSSATQVPSTYPPATSPTSTAAWSRSPARWPPAPVLLLDEPAAGLMRADKVALERRAAQARRCRPRRHPGRARHGAGDGHLRPYRRARRRPSDRRRHSRDRAQRAQGARGLPRQRRDARAPARRPAARMPPRRAGGRCARRRL